MLMFCAQVLVLSDRSVVLIPGVADARQATVLWGDWLANCPSS
jgi:hypothetical protein